MVVVCGGIAREPALLLRMRYVESSSLGCADDSSGHSRRRPSRTSEATDLQLHSFVPAAVVGGLVWIVPPAVSTDSWSGPRQWNEHVQRHHHLGHNQLSSPQLCCFVHSLDGCLVALQGFGEAASKTGQRDRVVGRSPAARERNLDRAVNHARFSYGLRAN